MNRPNARGLLDHPFLKEDGRKLSGNSGFSSPKVSHSFSSPRKYDRLLFVHNFIAQTFLASGTALFNLYNLPSKYSQLLRYCICWLNFRINGSDEPRQQAHHARTNSNTPQPTQPPPVQQQQQQPQQLPDDDNMMEEPTWTWGGDVCAIIYFL